MTTVYRYVMVASRDAWRMVPVPAGCTFGEMATIASSIASKSDRQNGLGLSTKPSFYVSVGSKGVIKDASAFPQSLCVQAIIAPQPKQFPFHAI